MAKRLIRGLVVDAGTRRPIGDVRVEAWLLEPAGDVPVGVAQTTADGAFAIVLDAKAMSDERGEIYFKVWRGDHAIADTRRQLLWTMNRQQRVVIAVQQAKAIDAAFQVQGTIATELGIAVAGAHIELWDRALDGDTLLATGVTGDKGSYTVAYDPAVLVAKQRADLSVRVIDAATRKELARSDVRYQAEPSTTVDLGVAGANVTRPSELDRLLSAASTLLDQRPLVELDAKAVEYVANRIRWDARNVAMAARAARLSASSGIPAAHYYALMRSGLSGDDLEIHRLSDDAVKRVLEIAVDRGVIGSEPPIDRTLKLYRQRSVALLDRLAPSGAISPLGDMLGLALDPQLRTTFLDVYRSTATDPDRMWSTLAERGFDSKTIDRLQVDGKLGLLTRQNAPLIQRLRDEAKIERPEDLARAGLYTADAWKAIVGHDAPAGIEADAYAAGLAAQVNLSYPTQVLAEMVRRDEVAGGPEVGAFLAAGSGRHTIGVDPVKRWTDYGQLSPEARTSALRLERQYQLSPSNEAMKVLQRTKLESSRDIVALPRDEFLARYGGDFSDATEAALVYQKAQEIHTTTLNVAAMYLAYRSAPNVYTLTGDTAKQAMTFGDVPGVPTLEDLLSSMDYCACDECKSVLGAAAYYVELLQFIDVPSPASGQNPQAVLFGRRPDLPELLLSCENTNVALPYIDIVNEILEYYVVKDGSLVDFHGHDMREDSDSAALVADPEHVQGAAYDKTKAAVYPYGLPFDMPLAALRLLMQAWHTTLADALRVFGSAASTRRELLALNATEHAIQTDQAFRPLPAYFGQPPGATIDELNAAVANGKAFCRITAIDYQDLVALLRTRFINAGAELVALLTPLQVSLAQLQAWYTGALDDAAFQALLPATLIAADYGGDILQWLRDGRARIMGLITLTDVGTEPKPCDFASLELRFALPDPAANRLTALAYHKLHRFIRLWKKLGWTIALTDRVVMAFLGIASDALTDGNLDATFTALVARIANFAALQRRKSIAASKIDSWLAIWDASLTAEARRDVLAHLLRLGTTDLVHLSELTGIDPLADDLASDAPSLLRFLDALDALAAARLKVVDVDYLLRHRDDGGTLAPALAAQLRDCKALRDGLIAVAADLAAPPANADLAFARSKLALVYDPAVVDRFVGLVGATTTYAAPLATVEEALPEPLVAADARLGYDPFAKRLTHAGALSAAQATALAARADTLVLGDVSVIASQPELDAYIAAVKLALQALVDAGVADLTALDAEDHELKAIYDAVAAIADPAAQASATIDAVLPALRARLQRISLRATLATLLKTDPPLVDVLTEGPGTLHAASAPAAGILDDFVALAEPLAFDASQSYALRLDPPATDNYILYVAAPAGTTITLAVDGQVVIPATVVAASGEVETAAVVALKAATLTAATLTIADLPAAAKAELRWRTKGFAKAPVPATRIYSEAALALARASLLRLSKAAALLRAMPLTPRELHHLAAVNADTAGYLDALDVAGTISDADLHTQWARFAWLSYFTRLKSDEPDPDTWVGLLEAPGQLTPNGTRVLAAAAGWSDDDLTAVLARFAMAISDVVSLHALRKVKDAIDFVIATGLPAADLVAWTVDAPDGALITAIKSTLRGRLDTPAWRDTLTTVNNALRNARRDALVAYILHHKPPSPAIDTADKLYEQFLIDVAMDACMKTSRIRQALSTVQLFVTRCLMNLEPEVAASSIRADQWAWMKRYRVWQANRQIFLFPENWLEPELRDNKSQFFLELESELVKSDITDELAETAYLAYLKKLDEVARLEIVGSFLEEKQPHDQTDDVLHVFGRSNGNTQQYYYRRFEAGSWTPWEKVGLHIEGDLVFPVVWKKRLFVFWLAPVPKPEGGTPTQSPEDLRTAPWGANAKLTAEITLAFGEYYRGKWTSPKSSELKAPIKITNLATFEPEKIVVSMRTHQPSAEVSERLEIAIVYMGSPRQFFNATFTTTNAPPTITTGNDSTLLLDVELFNYHFLWDPRPSAVLDANALREDGKVFAVKVAQPDGAASAWLTETLLTKTAKLASGFRVRPIMHAVENQFEAPLFYDDEHSVLLLTADEHVDSVAQFDGYFVAAPPSHVPDKVYVPPLYEQPIVKDPLGPVSDPLTRVINPNYENVIAANDRFAFGGAVFDARGVAIKEGV